MGFPESLGARAHSYLEENVKNKCPTHFTLVETEAGQRLVYCPRTGLSEPHFPSPGYTFLELSSLTDPRQACCAGSQSKRRDAHHQERRKGEIRRCQNVLVELGTVAHAWNPSRRWRRQKIAKSQGQSRVHSKFLG